MFLTLLCAFVNVALSVVCSIAMSDAWEALDVRLSPTRPSFKTLEHTFERDFGSSC
jgi:hypothetical protein